MIATSVIAACERPTGRLAAETAECPELVRFNPVNAVNDGARAATGEAYLLGVYGYSSEVPGQTRNDLPVRMIEGTSDYECLGLNARTREYAKRFNGAVQDRLSR